MRLRRAGPVATALTRGRATGLADRLSERETLDRLVEAIQAGEGRALVVRGDPGVGKTVLLGLPHNRTGRARRARDSLVITLVCAGRRWRLRHVQLAGLLTPGGTARR
jgi:hypothetical protein